MRFRIEFLLEAAETHSVCHARALRARKLEIAQLQAEAWAHDAKTRFGAAGFQIRWMDDQGRVVFVHAFDESPQAVH